MTKREWNSMVDPVSGFPIHGPYPDRGEYYFTEWEFDKGVENDSLDKIIGAIERGRDRSFQDVHDANAREYAQEDRAHSTEADARIRNAYTAFGVTGKPLSSLTGVYRGSKTGPSDLPSAPWVPKSRPKGLEIKTSLMAA
jgi:hypothetical protein